MRIMRTAAAALAMLALVACSGKTGLPEATGKGSIRALNAISTSPTFLWRIEERSLGTLDFKSWSSRQPYDDLEYTFNFEVLLAGDTSATRVASQFLDVVRDTNYTLILTGTIDAPDIIVWERPEPDLDPAAPAFEVQFGHLAPTMGSFDVYFAPPGTPPALGEQRATLAPGEISDIATLQAGDFVLTLTTAGDPSDVLFESATLSVAGGSALLFSTFDVDANILAPVSVQVFNYVSGAANGVPDVNFEPVIRFFHASQVAGPVDIYLDDPVTTAPLVADHVVGDITGFFPVPGDLVTLTYTAAGNMGAILLEEERAPQPGSRYHAFLYENADGENDLLDYSLNLRSIETQARFLLVNTVTLDTNLDVYLVTSGSGLAVGTLPIVSGYPGGETPLQFVFQEGSFDLYVTAEGDKDTVLAGPVALDLAFGDVFEVHLLETPDPLVIDVRVFTP